MRKQFALLLLVLAGLFALALPSAAQNLIQNGGFEEPVQNPYAGLGVGSTMGAWLVSHGTVFHMNNSYQAANTAYEGQQYLQLNATPCWVQQELVTVPGQTYQVSFQMSGNATPGYGQNADNSAMVIWYSPATSSNLYQHTYTYHQNNAFGDPMWQSISFTITAQSTHDILAFGSATVMYPWIDAVSVTPYTAKGTITGRVYDVDNPSIGVAHALLKSSSGTEVVADANGVYSIELAGDATVDIIATHDDYHVATVAGVHVVTDVSTTVDIPATHLPIPVASDIVSDTFARPSGLALGSTEDASARPWIRGSGETAASISDESLLLSPIFLGGVSVVGGYKPADLDVSVDLTMTEGLDAGAWGALAYREQIPGSFDTWNGQTDPGYMVNAYSDGSQIHIWRMASLASAQFSPPIDWSVPHRLRVKVTGANHQVYLDGVKIIDKMHGEKVAGGLVSCLRSNCSARFDNFTCTRYSSNVGQISGTLADITNPAQKIAGAAMWLDSEDRATSNGTGDYAFTRLGGGTYALTVTADGYYSKTYSGLVLADANSSVVQDIKMTPLPAQSNIVTDDFNRPDNWDSLGTTLAPQFIPWVADTESYGSYIEGNKLRQMSGASHGASLDGSFQPADLDVSATLATGGMGGWIGLGYRQQLAGTYDGFRDQIAGQAGYVVYLTDDGNQVILWRNGVIAGADVSLTPQQEHILRVRAVGSHHEVWVDGQKAIDAWDSQKLVGGYVGILSDQEWATADNFSVGTYVSVDRPIAAAKAAAVGSEVVVTGKVITAQWSGSTMYVEEPDKSAGIKVTLPTADPNLYKKSGVCVDVYGTLRMDSQTGELYIEASDYSEVIGAQNFLEPVVMDDHTAGDKGNDVTGLYAKVVGAVTAVNGTSDFTINDGTGDLKVVIDPSVTMGRWSSVGAQVEVEGIISLVGSTPATSVRCVKPWNTSGNLFEQQGRNPGFESANPMNMWGFQAVNGAAASQTWGHTNPHGGLTYAQITNASGLASNVYARLYQAYNPGMMYGVDYKLSCWVRGNNLPETSPGSGISYNWLGFWDVTRPGGGVYAQVPAFPAVSDITTVPWQKIGCQFTWTNTCDGMPAGMWWFQLLTQDVITELDADDFFLGYARGTVTETVPAPYTTVSGIKDAKAMQDNENVELTGKVVTASSSALGGKFYIEEQDRLGAIRCVLPAGATSLVAGGSTVNVQGTLSTTETGEREIVNALVTANDPLPAVTPLFMTNKTISALGASSLGLLVKTTGKVSQPDPAVPGQFILDDGSGVNLKVIGSVPNSGAFVTVVCIRSCELVDGVVTPVLLATGVDVQKTVVAVTHFGGANQIWLRAADCVARSVDGGTPNFVADPVAAATALSGSALYFPSAPDSGYSNTDPAQQLPWWVEYQIDASDLSAVTLGGSWGIWCRTTQSAVSTVESDWIVVNGDPAFLNKSNPTNADWMATLSMPNFAATPGGHVIVNNTSQSGSGGTLSGYAWGWWSRASATEIQHQPLNLVDGMLTFRIYEREAGATSARIDLICWSDSDSYKPTDADAALAASW